MIICLCNCIAEGNTPNLKHPCIRPQLTLIGVIGSGEYAKLIIERLLYMQYQVITSNKDMYNLILS